ncbi:hypothetical protein AGMMS50276_03390 [Synergistales bacterium]|nr:hypothetical protein AGMMS50276_03390 [Synergistales bacterium]
MPPKARASGKAKKSERQGRYNIDPVQERGHEPRDKKNDSRRKVQKITPYTFFNPL